MNFLNKTVLKGIGLMLLGMSTVPFLDVFAKLLSEDYSVMQVTWTRFFFPRLLADTHNTMAASKVETSPRKSRATVCEGADVNPGNAFFLCGY